MGWCNVNGETMRIVISWLLFSVVSSAAGVAQSTTPAESGQPFSVTISAPSTTVKAGSDVYVKLRLVKTSDHKISAGGVGHANGLNTGYSVLLHE